MTAKLNPTPAERKAKLYRILFRRWWRQNGLVVVMILNLVWLNLFWRSIDGVK
jgi:hypothetical protein